jgi:hypothetical protein
MARVHITGYEPGLRKIAMTKTIRLHSGLDLAAAIRCTGSVLVGETVVVEVPTPADAECLAKELQKLGAIATAE